MRASCETVQGRGRFTELQTTKHDPMEFAKAIAAMEQWARIPNASEWPTTFTNGIRLSYGVKVNILN